MADGWSPGPAQFERDRPDSSKVTLRYEIFLNIIYISR